MDFWHDLKLDTSHFSSNLAKARKDVLKFKSTLNSTLSGAGGDISSLVTAPVKALTHVTGALGNVGHVLISGATSPLKALGAVGRAANTVIAPILAVGKAFTSVATGGISLAVKGLVKIGSVISGALSSMLHFAARLHGIFGITFIGAVTISIAKSLEFEQSLRALNLVADRVGASFAKLAGLLNKGKGGIFSQIETLEGLKTAMALGFTEKEALKLFQPLRDAAALFGEDMNTAYTALARAALQGEPELAERLGLQLREYAVYKESFGMFGKRLRELDLEQKRTVVIAAALRQLNRYRGAENMITQTSIGSLKKFKAAFSDSMVALGDGIKKGLSNFHFLEKISDWFEDMSSGPGNMGLRFKRMMRDQMKPAFEMLEQFKGPMMDMLVRGGKSPLQTWGEKIGSVIQHVFGRIIQYGKIALDWVSNNRGILTQFFDAVFEAVSRTLGAAVKFITNNWRTLLTLGAFTAQAFFGIWQGLITGLNNLLTSKREGGFFDYLGSGLRYLSSVVRATMQTCGITVPKIGNLFLWLGGKVVEFAVNGIAFLIRQIPSIISFGDSFMRLFGRMWICIKSVFPAEGENATGIGKFIASLTSADAGSKSLTDTISNLAQKFSEWVDGDGIGFAQSFADSLKSATEWCGSLVTLLGDVVTVAKNLAGIVKGIFSIPKWLIDQKDKVLGAATGTTATVRPDGTSESLETTTRKEHPTASSITTGVGLYAGYKGLKWGAGKIGRRIGQTKIGQAVSNLSRTPKEIAKDLRKAEKLKIAEAIKARKEQVAEWERKASELDVDYYTKQDMRYERAEGVVAGKKNLIDRMVKGRGRMHSRTQGVQDMLTDLSSDLGKSLQADKEKFKGLLSANPKLTNNPLQASFIPLDKVVKGNVKTTEKEIGKLLSEGKTVGKFKSSAKSGSLFVQAPSGRFLGSIRKSAMPAIAAALYGAYSMFGGSERAEATPTTAPSPDSGIKSVAENAKDNTSMFDAWYGADLVRQLGGAGKKGGGLFSKIGSGLSSLWGGAKSMVSGAASGASKLATSAVGLAGDAGSAVVGPLQSLFSKFGGLVKNGLAALCETWLGRAAGFVAKQLSGAGIALDIGSIITGGMDLTAGLAVLNANDYAYQQGAQANAAKRRNTAARENSKFSGQSSNYSAWTTNNFIQQANVALGSEAVRNQAAVNDRYGIGAR